MTRLFPSLIVVLYIHNTYCCCFHKVQTPTPSTIQQTNCALLSRKLNQVLKVMCNNIANGTNTTLRDACVGCFQQATIANNDQPSLSALSTCASTYLTNTNYTSCIQLIQGVDVNPRSGKCVNGYCGFVRCIQKVNANILISRCYNSSIALATPIYPNQQVEFYKNITSCILALVRCSSSNPITGQPEVPQISDALQITPNGALRVLGLPNTAKVQNSFCQPTTTLQQSTWMNYTCN